MYNTFFQGVKISRGASLPNEPLVTGLVTEPEYWSGLLPEFGFQVGGGAGVNILGSSRNRSWNRSQH